SLFNLTRTLGGSFGIAILATTLVNRQHFHFERFGESITQFSTATQQQIAAITNGFIARGGYDASTASHQAVAAVFGRLMAQSYVGACADCGVLLGATLTAAMLMTPFFSGPPKGAGAPTHVGAE